MAALLCAQCSAPLSLEASQGRAPCAYCGVLNAVAANPYAHPNVVQPRRAEQMFAQASGPAWICSSCRKENQAHYQFCLGCGGAQGSGERFGNEASTAGSPPRFPVILVVIAALVVGGALTAFLLAR